MLSAYTHSALIIYTMTSLRNIHKTFEQTVTNSSIDFNTYLWSVSVTFFRFQLTFSILFDNFIITSAINIRFIFINRLNSQRL